MSFLRFSSRCLLAGYFVADGLKAAANPEPLRDEAEPFAEKFTKYADRFLPAGLARRVPTKTTTLVRLHGIVQAAGALMMATGLFRRTGAVLVATAYLPKVLAARPSETSQILPFARELALLGGAMVEAGNTQGKPDHAWRSAQRRKARVSRCADRLENGRLADKKSQSRQADALRQALSSATS